MTESLHGLSLRELEYVAAVADHAHFGRAADACHVSQPSLSAGIQKVEALLGYRIFERTSRRVLITVKGERAVERARLTLDAARRFLAGDSGSDDPLTGRFALGAIATVGPYLLPKVLAPLREAHPGLELRIEEGLTDGLLQRLRDGTLDAVILSPPVSAEGLNIAPLYWERFRLIEPASAATSLGAVDLASRDAHQAVLLEDGHCLRDQALSVCNAAGIRPQHTAMSLETLKAMVAAGSGFSLIPETAIRAGETMGGLVRYRDLSDPKLGRAVSVAWRRSREPDIDVLALIEVLRACVPTGAVATDTFDSGPGPVDNRAGQHGDPG